MKIWDAWYGDKMLHGQADFFHTNLLFYPDGVSLTFHNFSLPQMILMAAMQSFLPTSNAFNLAYLLLVFFTILSAYVYLNYLFQDKWIGLFGATVFGTCAYVMLRPHHPEISTLVTVPLSLYFIHRALLEERWKLIVIAGLLVGASAFIGLYTLVCLLITLGLYILCFAVTKWRLHVFWLHLCLLTLVIAPFVLLRFYPMFVDPSGQADALAKSSGVETENDLTDYFANYGNPVMRPLWETLFGRNHIRSGPWVYLGYIPLGLIALALAKYGRRRQLYPWLVCDSVVCDVAPRLNVVN